MADLDRWTQGDDDTMRETLGLLRHDVQSLPLADVRFIRTRGSFRRRRSLVVATASAAAAVVAIGFLGFHNLASNRALDVGPATTTTNSANPTKPPQPPRVPGLLPAPGPLPVPAEWKRALGITTRVAGHAMRSGEGFSNCVRSPGAQVASGSLVASPTLDGTQAVYRANSTRAGDAAAAKVVGQLLGSDCKKQREIFRPEADAAWPKVFSSNATGAGRFWFVVAHHGPLTSLLALSDAALGDSQALPRHWSLAQIQALALVAQLRLVREVEGASPSTGGRS